jgi:hypothetical protein
VRQRVWKPEAERLAQCLNSGQAILRERSRREYLLGAIRGTQVGAKGTEGSDAHDAYDRHGHRGLEERKPRS